MLHTLRIFLSTILLMATLLSPAIALALANSPEAPNPAFFIAGVAMMTPTI